MPRAKRVRDTGVQKRRVKPYLQRMTVKRPIMSGLPKTYTFRRTLQQVLPVNLSVGFATGGYSLQIAPALSACNIFINGTLAYQPLLPNSGEFTSLFDQYRIDRINLQLFFSANDSNVTTPTSVLPMVHIANDYNDTNNTSLTDIQQYPEMRTYQLGLEKPVTWSFRPRVRLDVLTNTGITSSSAFSTTGWIDTSSPGIEHLGTKVYLNTMGRTTNLDIGNCVLMVSYDLSFRNVK